MLFSEVDDLRGPTVEVRVLQSKDVNGAFVTRAAEELRVSAEVDAEINKHSIIWNTLFAMTHCFCVVMRKINKQINK